MKKSIVWLASYPKSGNTWTRMFLANYMVNADKPVPINQAHRFAMGDSIARMYEIAAGRRIDISDVGLTLQLRDRVLRGVVNNNADVNFVKTHNCRSVAQGVELIPEKYTRSAIYIVRNPLDMVLSYARHYGLSHADAVAQILHHENANAPAEGTVAQFLGSWAEHVKSWTGPAPYPTVVVRYEDLLDDPQTHFAKILTHVGLPVDEARLDKAIRFSSFDELSKQEEKEGFVERSDKTDKFFGSGRKGKWKTDLADDLAQRIRRSERKVMKKYGYLDG